MPVATDCPDYDTLRRMALGQTPEDMAEETALHLAECPRCAGVFDGVIQPVLMRARPAAGPAADSGLIAVVAARAKALFDRADDTPANRTGESATGDGGDRRTGVPLGRLGKFELLAELGRGGMGAVYRARDPRLNRDVALKVILTDDGRQISDVQRGRFLREARAAAAVRHPHIVPVFEVDEHDGTPYLVMPLLAGETLADRLRRDGPLDPAEVVRLGAQMAAGLAEAHAARLVHRDIKPANIWLEPRDDGTVQLLDFGLAKPTDDTDDNVTGPNRLAGTPAYMSPEQADAGTLDHRSDLFSLGLVLYEMLRGAPLFSAGPGKPPVLAQVRRFQTIPPSALLPGVPALLAELVAGLLQPKPDDRSPGTAAELADRLRRLAADRPTGPLPKRHRVPTPLLIAAAVGFAVVAVLVGQVVLVVKKNKDDPGFTLTVPDKSNVNVGPDGTVTVTLNPDGNAPAPAAAPAAGPRWPDPPGNRLVTLDDLKRSAIDPGALKAAGFGDPGRVPKEVVAAVQAHTGWTWALALHPNGYLVASGGQDGVIRLWRLVGPAFDPVATLRTEGKPVRALAFSPDGKFLVGGDDAGTAIVWDVKTRSVLKTYQHPNEPVVAVAVAPDSRQFVLGHTNDSETTRLYELPPSDNPGKVIRGSRTTTAGLAYRANGKAIVLGSNALLREYDARTEEATLVGNETKVWYWAVAVHPRRDLVAVNGFGLELDGRPSIGALVPGFGDNRDVAKQRCLSVRDPARHYTTLKRLQHQDRVTLCGFSDDGKRLVTRAQDGTTNFWDWEAEQLLLSVKYVDLLRNDGKPPQEIGGLAVHPDGRHAIVGTTRGMILVIRYTP